MSQLTFRAFDADHHYYEAEDAFTRHVDPRLQPRAMQWAVINGKKRLLVGGRVNRFIPNPTFDPVARPGVLDEYFRGRNPEGKDMRALFGALDRSLPSLRLGEVQSAVVETTARTSTSNHRYMARPFIAAAVPRSSPRRQSPNRHYHAFYTVTFWSPGLVPQMRYKDRLQERSSCAPRRAIPRMGYAIPAWRWDHA